MVTDKRRIELLREHFSKRADRVLSTYESADDVRSALDRERLRRALAAICHNVPEGSSVLDLGSGCGLGASTLAQLGYRVTAVEMVPEIIAEARRRHGNDVRWVEKPFDLTVAPLGSFDVVLSLGFLEYQERAGKELVRMRRMLKPGGILLLSVPNTLSRRFSFGLTRAYFRVAKEPEQVPIRHSFTPERLQRCLGMAGFILMDYEWLPEGEGADPLKVNRDRQFWRHRVKNRAATEMLTLSRCYRPEDTEP